MLPVAGKVQRSYLDELTKGLVIEINVLAELAGAIVYQKERISQFAPNEKNLPLGMTSEQQRKEVATLADMLVKMRDTQLALGMVPVHPRLDGYATRASGTINASSDDQDFGTDPVTEFLLNHPHAVSLLTSGLDLAVAGVVDGQSILSAKAGDRHD